MRRRRLLLPLVLAVVSCSYVGTSRKFDERRLASEPGWVAVRDVPLVEQEQRQDCGAAALAMVLAYWRVPTTVEEVRTACHADDHGIQAGALRDFARAKGLQAFLIHGDVGDLVSELSRSRPVLVGLAQPYVTGTFAHYEVVVGVHPERGIVVTLDPARGWQQNEVAGFLREWQPVGSPTLVVFAMNDDSTSNSSGP